MYHFCICVSYQLYGYVLWDACGTQHTYILVPKLMSADIDLPIVMKVCCRPRRSRGRVLSLDWVRHIVLPPEVNPLSLVLGFCEWGCSATQDKHLRVSISKRLKRFSQHIQERNLPNTRLSLCCGYMRTVAYVFHGLPNIYDAVLKVDILYLDSASFALSFSCTEE